MLVNQNFLDSISKTPTLNNQMRKLAESASIWPDLSMKFPYSNPIEAISSILIASAICAGKNEYYFYKLKEELANVCFKNNYQGKWKLVQELIETSPHYLGVLSKTVVNNFSPQDIFGNIVPTIHKMCKLLMFKKPSSNRKRVRKPQRKRGYNDKGSRRFPHEIHQCWSFTGENPKRIDLRHRISAPNRKHFWRRSE